MNGLVYCRFQELQIFGHPLCFFFIIGMGLAEIGLKCRQSFFSRKHAQPRPLYLDIIRGDFVRDLQLAIGHAVHGVGAVQPRQSEISVHLLGVELLCREV